MSSSRVKTVEMDGVSFRISRMGIMTSGPLMVWLQNSFKDTIAAAMSGISASTMNAAITKATNAQLSQGDTNALVETIKTISSTLTEDQFKAILARFIFEPECITFSRNGSQHQLLTRFNIEVQDHDGVLVGAIDDPADLLMLLVEVVRHNYDSFFPKMAAAIGRLMPARKQ